MIEEETIWAIRATLPDGTTRMVHDDRGIVCRYTTLADAQHWQDVLRTQFPEYHYAIGCTEIRRTTFDAGTT